MLVVSCVFTDEVYSEYDWDGALDGPALGCEPDSTGVIFAGESYRTRSVSFNLSPPTTGSLGSVRGAESNVRAPA